MITRKHFIKVAKIIKDLTQSGTDVTNANELITEFSKFFYMDNKNFDEDRFKSAVLNGQAEQNTSKVLNNLKTGGENE